MIMSGGVMFDVLGHEGEASVGRGDRRVTTRFPIERQISYQCARGRGWTEPHLGKTMNISSTGVLFSGEHSLLPGSRLQLAISWPVQLNGNCGLKLVASGTVVRCSGTIVAVKIRKYDFHVQRKGAAVSSTLSILSARAS